MELFDLEFLRSPGTPEWVMLALFGLLLIGYSVRHFYLARQGKSQSLGLLSKAVLRSLYFPLLVLCLLGPAFGETKVEVKSIGKDIFLLVDISKSMDARDIVPSRLQKIKFEIKKIARAFSSDNLGIIAFSSEAFMQCPLTFDDNMLMIVVEALNTGQISTGGTDFAPALEMALEKLKDADHKTPQANRSSLILLISDGEDFGDSSLEVAEKLRDEGIKLFTLGVGTSEGAKIPTGNGYKTDNNGELIISRLESASLKKIAELSGGKYYEITDQKSDIPMLISDMESIEGELKKKRKVDSQTNKYFYFLCLAILLIFFDIIITVKVIKI